MDPGQSAEIETRARIAGLGPSAVLSISAVVLAKMPVVHALFARWSIIAVWLFVINQVVTICQGAVIVIACGLQDERSKLRRHGFCLIVLGVSSTAMTFWFACLAVFGGPARDQMPYFLATLWLLGASAWFPAAIYLRRRYAKVIRP